eukprot:scaffold2.g6920.t1
MSGRSGCTGLISRSTQPLPLLKSELCIRMECPEKELPELLNRLLQAPAAQQRRLIEALYTPGARLTHALVIAENREEIILVFQHWRFMNRGASATVHEIVVDRGGARAWVRLTQHVRAYLHSPLSFHLPMATLLYLEDAPGGRKRIAKQVDFHSFEGMLFTFPWLGWVMEHVVRRLLTWAILLPARAAGAAAPAARRAAAAVRRALPPRAAAEWDAAGAAAAALWWAPARAGGRACAPYDPRL